MWVGKRGVRFGLPVILLEPERLQFQWRRGARCVTWRDYAPTEKGTCNDASTRFLDEVCFCYRSDVQLASTIPGCYKGNLPCAINVTIPIKKMCMRCRAGMKF